MSGYHPVHGENSFWISMDISRLIRRNILLLEPYHCARETVQEGLLLDANENPYPDQREGVVLNRYPDPSQRELRESIACYVGVALENIVVGSGSDEVVDWIFKVFCQPGVDQIAIAQPTYGMYQVTADVFGIATLQLPLDKKFDFDANKFLETIPSQTKVLFLCSPNNPTGNLLDRRQILKLCRLWGKIVVVDEAYIEFSDQPSLVVDQEAHPNLILLRTLSKAFGLAGLRLGYAVASEEIIAHFLRVKAPYNLSALTMNYGCQVLENWADRSVQVQAILRERQRLSSRLNQIQGIWDVFPSQANFILFHCTQASQVCKRLLEKGIVVRDRSNLMGLEDCIRVTVGTAAENDVFLNELQELL